MRCPSEHGWREMDVLVGSQVRCNIQVAVLGFEEVKVLPTFTIRCTCRFRENRVRGLLCCNRIARGDR
jgi:hypothetical protein